MQRTIAAELYNLHAAYLKTLSVAYFSAFSYKCSFYAMHFSLSIQNKVRIY